MTSPGAYIHRIRSLGWPILLTGLSALLALIALTQPVWAIQQDMGDGDLDKSSYAWTTLIEEEWRNGVFAGTTFTPYTSPTFDEFRMREAAATSYLIGTIYLVLLAALGAVLNVARRRPMPRAVLLVAHLVVLTVGTVTLLLPVFLIPPAAAADVDGAVAGFGGRATVLGDVLSWGPASSWWLWMVSLLASSVALAIPLVSQALPSRLAPVH